MEYSKVIEHTMDDYDRTSANEAYQAIQDASNGTDRSKQQQNFRLGMSNIGHCQQASLYMIKQTPPSDIRDKSAAFFGTVAGEAIEKQMKQTHPDWLFQQDLVFAIPSGGEIGGHPDIVRPADACVDVDEFESWHRFNKAKDAGEVEGPELPQPYVQGIDDLKSKDKLDVIKKYGPSKQQVFQLSGYASAAIDAGLLDPSKPIRLADVYFDRSGSQHEAYTFGWWYDPNVLLEIDDWIHDLKYATVTGSDGMKEMPREWCWNWCEYATLCRGNDTDVEGLIEDPEVLAAVDVYASGLALEKEGKKLKDNAKLAIPSQLSGSTGTHNVRWIEIGATVVAESRRAGYRKLDIRPVPGPKKPRAKAKPKPKVDEEAI